MVLISNVIYTHGLEESHVMIEIDTEKEHQDTTGAAIGMMHLPSK